MCMLSQNTWGLCALKGVKPLSPGLSRAGHKGQGLGGTCLGGLLTHDIVVRNPTTTSHLPPPAPL